MDRSLDVIHPIDGVLVTREDDVEHYSSLFLELAFKASEPLITHLMITRPAESGETDIVDWTFARSLLRSVITASFDRFVRAEDDPSGRYYDDALSSSDVLLARHRVSPDADREVTLESEDEIRVFLSSPDGEAMLALDADQVSAFVTAIYELVPITEESRLTLECLDAYLIDLLASPA